METKVYGVKVQLPENASCEERLACLVKFVTTGLNCMVASGTDYVAKDQIFMAEKRFVGATTLLQVARFMCDLFPELDGCRDFREVVDRDISEQIRDTTFMMHSGDFGSC